MALSYEYSIGSVKAKENALLTSQDIERMVEFKSLSELINFLNEKNYGDGETIDEILSDKASKTWDYIRSIVPEEKLFNCFLFRNDVHNIKSVIKGTLAQAEYSSLFIYPLTIQIEDIEEAVKQRKFSALPAWIAPASAKAYDVIAHTNDARMSDAYLDKACMEEMLKASAKTSSEFLRQYIKTIVFYNNVKIAIRGARTNAPKDYFDCAICEDDGFDYSALKANAVKGESSLLEYLAKKSEYSCDKAVEAYKESASKFEKFVDDKLMISIKEVCKHSGEGADTVIGYYLAIEAESKAIHIIASSISTRTDSEKTKERLRLIYG